MIISKKCTILILLAASVLGWGLSVYEFFAFSKKNETFFSSSMIKNGTELEVLNTPFHEEKSETSSRERMKNTNDNFKFISPLLDCEELNSNISNRIIQNASKQVHDFVSQKINSKEAQGISVYFRELNDGPWFGIQENSKFLPGSLLKVPLLISVLKKSEQTPEILDKKIIFTKEDKVNLEQHFVSQSPLKLKNNYSVGELLDKMIVASDNDAANLVLKNLSFEEVADSYTDLGLVTPDSSGVTTRAYASFFRILYNASYLNKQNSEHALSLLSKTDFYNGLVAGLPPEVVAAHKFGEKGKAGDELVQLHDCGIIYYSSNPYILCVMTQGKDYDVLSQIIAKISNIVYGVVSKQD